MKIEIGQFEAQIELKDRYEFDIIELVFWSDTGRFRSIVDFNDLPKQMREIIKGDIVSELD